MFNTTKGEEANQPPLGWPACEILEAARVSSQSVLSYGGAMMVLGGCRVVSAETKAIPHRQLQRSSISGPLEVVGVGRRYCRVQSGYLELEGPNKPSMKIALRGLHLISAGWLTFKLISEEYSLVFRAEREEDYWRWVKCLAAELLRQTPLTCLPYLDILGITGTLRRAQSEGCLSPKATSLPDIVADTCRPKFGRTEEVRGKTCATAYMPVKERKKMWEEKSRNGSAHGGSLGNLAEACKASSHPSVRQLCRMFESSSSSLPPRRSASYLGMKENIPCLLNSPGPEETRGRKQFRISDMKLRHHSNVR